MEKFLKQRRKIAKTYIDSIKNDKYKLPFMCEKSNHTFNQFTIRVKNRKKLEQYLPIYKYKAYKNDNIKTLPMVEKVSKECLSLPIYPELPIKNVNKICKILNDY